jgi:hypothetical protein
MGRRGTWVAGLLSVERVELDLRQLFALNVLLQLVDGIITYRALEIGMLEGNPLLNASIATVGTGSALLLYKANACGLLFLVQRRLPPPLGGPVLLGVALATALLALVPWLGKLLAFAAI